MHQAQAKTKKIEDRRTPMAAYLAEMAGRKGGVWWRNGGARLLFIHASDLRAAEACWSSRARAAPFRTPRRATPNRNGPLFHGPSSHMGPPAQSQRSTPRPARRPTIPPLARALFPEGSILLQLASAIAANGRSTAAAQGPEHETS
jgi:hypothetical protein